MSISIGFLYIIIRYFLTKYKWYLKCCTHVFVGTKFQTTAQFLGLSVNNQPFKICHLTAGRAPFGDLLPLLKQLDSRSIYHWEPQGGVVTELAMAWWLWHGSLSLSWQITGCCSPRNLTSVQIHIFMNVSTSVFADSYFLLSTFGGVSTSLFYFWPHSVAVISFINQH